MQRSLVSLLLLGLLPGCASATFTQTSSSYRPQPSDVPPKVYVDHLPAQPYKSVGIIRIEGPSSYMATYMKLAKQKGQELGCDVVVLRSIHHVRPSDSSSGVRTATPLLAVLASVPSRSFVSASTIVVVAQETDYRDRDFICGIYVDAPAPPRGAEPSAEPDDSSDDAE